LAWFKEFTLKEINDICNNTIVSHLGIIFTEIGENYLKAQMPVDNRTIQPMGILHGGASVTLAETIGSLAAQLSIDQSRYNCVGLDINANHIKSKTKGIVTGIGEPIHFGRRTQIWQMRIFDEDNNLVNISRLTIAVLEK
jgi:1,4-dihydroxy-2-naphthoyl-CoA hydrolase